jgi:hypothetical protein
MQPGLSELISSVSTMLHCQMMRDFASPEARKRILVFFCEDTYTGKEVVKVPPVRVIYKFLKKVFVVSQFHVQFSVIMLVYINRLIGITGLPLTPNNWKPVTISALCLAQKVWDDTPLVNADFCILYPVLNKKQVNFLERQFLDLLEFRLTVSSSLYAQYFFELESIFFEENLYAKPPLKTVEERRKAHRDRARARLGHEYQLGRKTRYTRTSKTLDEVFPPIGRYILS